MRVLPVLLAVAAAASWGVGGILVKRGTDVVSPATILVFQYTIGVGLVLAWLGATRAGGSTWDAVGRRWPALLAIALLQIAGYVFFITAVERAGVGSVPTAVAIAIAASYPALVVILSGPFLGETLHWNHVAGALLVVSGVVLAVAL